MLDLTSIIATSDLLRVKKGTNTRRTPSRGRCHKPLMDIVVVSVTLVTSQRADVEFLDIETQGNRVSG